MIVDPGDVPVYFNNYTRLHAIRQLIDWLLIAGTKRIEILDNNSTYPPLLYYYQNLPNRVRVTGLGGNFGPWAFWERGFHLQQPTPYIVSDPDLSPTDECPKDLVNRLQTLLHESGRNKVGPGLLFPGLYDNLKGWGAPAQKRFWQDKYSEDVFIASIDTTFAIYPALSPFTQTETSLRTGRPYVLRHTSSYIHDYISREEEDYYISSASKKWSQVPANSRQARHPDPDLHDWWDRRRR